VEEVRRELASEREGLTEAVGDLREQGGRLRSRLPALAGGAVGTAIALRLAKRLLLRR
jgi:hypothetical protein